MKIETQGLIQELREACRQTLFNGNDLGVRHYPPRQHSQSSGPTSLPAKRRRMDEATKPRTWEKILVDLVDILPSLSEQEHGQVFRCASIMLLGFLMPLSTGNEFFLLQNLSNKAVCQQPPGAPTDEIGEADTTEIVLNMSLEERIQSVPFRYSSTEFGEIYSITDELVDTAFCSFIHKAIGPLLRGRPAHIHEVDLLHVIAMAIHPHPSDQPIRSTIRSLEESMSRHWAKAKRLMTSEVSDSFELNYGHRLKLVQLIADNLSLPEQKQNEDMFAGPLLDGAVHHLRASLYAFGMASLSPQDNHWSECALVSLAIQKGAQDVVREEWGRLLNRLMDDTTVLNRFNAIHRERASLSLMQEQEGEFNLLAARGKLLEQFLTRFSEARHYADADFLAQVLGSLSDAIEYKVDDCTKEESSDEVETMISKQQKPEGGNCSTKTPSQKDSDTDVKNANTTNQVENISPEVPGATQNPLVLSSLLFAAKSIFYFLQTEVKKDGEETDDNQPRDMLISCGIQLVHHWDASIAYEASQMLVLAFSYGHEAMLSDYIGALFESVKLAVEKVHQKWPGRSESPIEGLVAYVSGRSVSFAEAILRILLARMKAEEQNCLSFRLMAQTATACPLAVKKYDKEILDVLNATTNHDLKSHLVVSLMACRRTRIFSNGSNALISAFENMSRLSGWSLYKMGRHAMASGCFPLAQCIFDDLLTRVAKEDSFIWLSSLQLVSEAESSLMNHGAASIPNSTMLLRSAISSFLVMPTSSTRGKSPSFELQTRFLNLRVEILDLLCTVRQLTAEMRVTNCGPTKFTRSNLHLQNSVKLFELLGSKFLTLYREHGLFVCQQSRTSLRTLHALCRFLSSATRTVFVDNIRATKNIADFQKNAIRALHLPNGDTSHPLTLLMQHLDKAVLKDMKSSVDPKIRASAMLQVIDGVLKAPSPFPKSFLKLQALQKAEVQMSLDPDMFEYLIDGYEGFDEGIHVTAGTLLCFQLHGRIPDHLFKQATIPFHVILVWYRLIKHSSNEATSDATPGDKGEGEKESSASKGSKTTTAKDSMTEEEDPPPEAASLNPSGTFFMRIERDKPLQPGYYSIETHLGCRDIRGGQWELATAGGSPTLSIRVSRST